jgi:hypothetical protein
VIQKRALLKALNATVLLLALRVAGAEPSADPPNFNGVWESLWQDSYSGMTSSFDPERTVVLPAVDRTSGEAYLSMWDHGIWKCKEDGKTFIQVDGGKISGSGCGPIQGNAFYIHPDGKKLVTFNMNNAPGSSGFSIDGGKSWNSFESVGRNWDMGAMDWSSETVFAARHEDEGLHVSTDAGKTWSQLKRPRGPVAGLGVAGKSLLLSTEHGIERSEDLGTTWEKVSALTATGPILEFKEKLWWLSPSAKAVLVSTDKGRTWEIHGRPAPDSAEFGPFFGNGEKHLVLAGKNGFYETNDGCMTWRLAAPAPDDYKLFGAAYDPVHEIFYASGFGLPVMKFARFKKTSPLPLAESSAPRPKAEFIETAQLKVRCTVGSGIAVNGNFLYVAGEDGLIYFKRDTQSGRLAFINQIEEFKCGGYTIAAAAGRLYAATPHNGYRRMSWHGLAWFDLDSQTGQPVRKGVVNCPASRQIVVGPGGKDLYLKSYSDNQDKIFWYRIGDDGKAVKSGEVSGVGIGASAHSDFPGILQISSDGKHLYSISAKDYAIAIIARTASGELTYKGSTDLNLVTKADSGNYDYQWVSLGMSPDGEWVYANVRNGKPSNNFYGIFKRDPETGALKLQETISGEQDSLANMKGWNVVSSTTGKGIYLGSFAGPLMTCSYDSRTGHLANATVVHQTKGNGTSLMAYDREQGMLYVTGREYGYDRLFSLKADAAVESDAGRP